MDDIRQFIAENREIATVQAQRWQGVDPSRLLQALDYLETMLSNASPYTLGDDITRAYVDACGQALSTLKDVSELRQQLSQGTELTVTQLEVHRDIVMRGAEVYVEARGYLEPCQIERLVADVRDKVMKARLSL